MNKHISMQRQNALSVSDDRPQYRAGEEKLWLTVLWTAIKELDKKLANAKRQQDSFGCVSIGLKWDIDTILVEINHEWFKFICFLIDKSHDHILTKVRQLKQKYGYDKVMFVSRLEMIELHKKAKKFKEVI